ncbi:MAG: cell division protein ZapA [Pseudomonadota bacterium]
MSPGHAKISVDGETFTIGCDPGDEERLAQVAGELDAMIGALRGSLGDMGEHRLALIAGVTALERLAAAEEANRRLKDRMGALERAREASALAADSDNAAVVARIEAVTAAVDRVAVALNRNTRAMSGMGETPEKPVPTAGGGGAVPPGGKPTAAGETSDAPSKVEAEPATA